MNGKKISRVFCSSGTYCVSNYKFRIETIFVINGKVECVEYTQWGKEQYKIRKFYRGDKEFDAKFKTCIEWLIKDNKSEFLILLGILKSLDKKYYEIAKSTFAT